MNKRDGVRVTFRTPHNAAGVVPHQLRAGRSKARLNPDIDMRTLYVLSYAYVGSSAIRSLITSR